MTKLELVELLKDYEDETVLNFFLIPNDGSAEDSDENDEPIRFVGELHTGMLDDETPQVDLGFEIR